MSPVRRRAAAPLRVLVVVAAALAATGCDHGSDASLAEARRSGTLVVVTRNGSSTYYESRDGADGYEYALAKAFADYLGLGLRVELRDSIPAVLAAIRRGEGHIGAAALTRTEARQRRHRFGPDYKTVQQLVVCHRDGPAPRTPADLVGVDVLVLAGSSYEERLRELAADLPGLAWRTGAAGSSDEILERVWRGEADCAVADSNLVAINRRYFPELDVAFAISEPQQLAWVLPADADALARALDKWFEIAAASGLLARLDERYFAHVALFDYVDLKHFMRRVDTRLPDYEALFRAAAAEHGLPWKLLAAIAYQESHWDPKARSPTGVRGLMMLTRTTARSLGVRDRLDAKQSIVGGARYLARLLERIPQQVRGPDRTWFALAAYNVGFGHLQDARVLARRLAIDPNSWHALKTVLPLLARSEYYRKLQHGYARGSEPVRYVERIRSYLDLLDRRPAPMSRGS